MLVHSHKFGLSFRYVAVASRGRITFSFEFRRLVSARVLIVTPTLPLGFAFQQFPLLRHFIHDRLSVNRVRIDCKLIL